MFQVVQPLALLALGTLAVPLLIHLRRRPVPVVRVGSLRPFLAHRKPSRPRALQDWPVLLLRCALLAALALALAGLQWTPRTPSPARWCLLLPGTRLHEEHLRDWNLRLQDGFEPRWLAPDFPPIRDPNDSPPPNIRAPVWPLLGQADRRLVAGSEAWVFGPTWSSLFDGTRPTLANLRLQWQAVPTPPPAPPPPSTPRVTVVHSPDRALDAAYVRAALQAMGATVVSNEVPTWIFQLGPAALPLPREELEKHGVRIVRDPSDTAEPETVSRRIEIGSQTVVLRRRAVPGPGIPLFRDSQGDPWLTEERRGSVVLWHVAFRFRPDWTDWPLEGAFPAWWQEHLRPAPPRHHGHRPGTGHAPVRSGPHPGHRLRHPTPPPRSTCGPAPGCSEPRSFSSSVSSPDRQSSPGPPHPSPPASPE
jgi:hypothetical protein